MNSVIKHNMMITIFFISCHIILVSGSSVSDDVHQIPADIIKNKRKAAKINCYHTNDNYDQILWYKQAENKQLQLLGYYYVGSANLEPGVNMKIEGGANKNQNCTLTIEGLNSSSSAVYFCAARYHSAARLCSSVQKPPHIFYLRMKAHC
ncbi:T-cell receptor beta chain V region C5 Precursor [Channa argus]|nr:T-cell receptor beta chain V region C5 Precursor [Channa argus]